MTVIFSLPGLAGTLPQRGLGGGGGRPEPLPWRLRSDQGKRGYRDVE